MILKDVFDRIVVLNLKRRPDRLAAFWKELDSKNWPFLKPEIFQAIDGNSVPTPHGWIGGGGAWGCCQSHRQVLERAILDGVRHLLVLEDDLVMRSTFSHEVQQFLSHVPDDFDGLMLGGQHMTTPRPVSDGIVKCVNCQRTHAYSVRGRYMRELYSLWCSTGQTTHIDHSMGPFAANFNVYSAEPFLIGQSRSRSDISGAMNPAKFWRSPKGDEPLVLLHAPQPVVAELRQFGIHTGYDRNHEDIDRGLAEVFDGKKALSEWVDQLMWEIASEEGFICTVWHPAATVQMLRQAWAGPVIEITATNVEDALAQLGDRVKKVKTRKKAVIVLDAPRDVAEALSGHGAHRGYWNDQISGVDNGLRQWQIGCYDLAEIIQTLSKEAESIRNGIPCLWFPKVLKVADVEAATKLPVIEIKADTLDEALEKLDHATYDS